MVTRWSRSSQNEPETVAKADRRLSLKPGKNKTRWKAQHVAARSQSNGSFDGLHEKLLDELSGAGQKEC